ncbi:MAG: peptidylprolyl isomerase [Cellvibrionales bacterium TMED49]|nr:MAG: peptidylprolyl isomerase [Cellvibrionales bacterium TMED49]|tara:strand:- start:126 stop:554 length:429 start_codon:yes stop_codon:yes gene_type:complete
MNAQCSGGASMSLNFSLELENGEIIDSNFNSPPVTFSFGDGSLLGGFEEPLKALNVGDEGCFLIPPERAFGQYNMQNVQRIPRKQFPRQDFELGAVFSFQNGDGELPGVVLSLSDEDIVVDFNHPLAGKSIVFKVKIFNILR